MLFYIENIYYPQGLLYKVYIMKYTVYVYCVHEIKSRLQSRPTSSKGGKKRQQPVKFYKWLLLKKIHWLFVLEKVYFTKPQHISSGGTERKLLVK